MLFDPRERQAQSDDLLEDPELCENLDDVLEEEESADEDDEHHEDDPWEKQIRIGRKQSTTYNVW